MVHACIRIRFMTRLQLCKVFLVNTKNVYKSYTIFHTVLELSLASCGPYRLSLRRFDWGRLSHVKFVAPSIIKINIYLHEIPFSKKELFTKKEPLNKNYLLIAALPRGRV